MKIPRILITSLFMLTSIITRAEEVRTWTQAATGKTLSGKLEGKSADGSKAKIYISSSAKTIEISIDGLSEVDKSYIAGWEKQQTERGIVISKPNKLAPANGGFGVQINELGKIFEGLEEVTEDLAAHPEVVIFDGVKGFYGYTGQAPVTYLMPIAKAEALLPPHCGAVSEMKTVAPGLPPGMKLKNYDIECGPYNRMTIMIDGIGQVVTLEFIAQNKPVQIPYLTGLEWRRFDMATTDFLDTSWSSSRIYLYGKPNLKDSYVVHLVGKGTITWFVPAPVVRQILFNVREKQKTGRK